MYNLSYLQNEYGGLFNVLVALLVRYTSELKNNKKNNCWWMIQKLR